MLHMLIQAAIETIDSKYTYYIGGPTLVGAFVLHDHLKIISASLAIIFFSMGIYKRYLEIKHFKSEKRDGKKDSEEA